MIFSLFFIFRVHHSHGSRKMVGPSPQLSNETYGASELPVLSDYKRLQSRIPLDVRRVLSVFPRDIRLSSELILNFEHNFDSVPHFKWNDSERCAHSICTSEYIQGCGRGSLSIAGLWARSKTVGEKLVGKTCWVKFFLVIIICLRLIFAFGRTRTQHSNILCPESWKILFRFD